MTVQTKKQAIAAAAMAALSVADEVAKGVLAPASLDAAAEAECRALFCMVVGPTDPLWELHVDVARQVLSLDGVPADELAEWLAVRRSTMPPREPSWIEQALGMDLDLDEDDHDLGAEELTQIGPWTR